jgi:hypothetical protein
MRSMGYAHHFRPTNPDFQHGAPPTSVCAAFIKESRMKVTNASKLDRKSGVRCCERGVPVRFPPTLPPPGIAEFVRVDDHQGEDVADNGFVYRCGSSWPISG